MKNITDLEEERMMKFQSIKEIVMRFMKKMKKDRVSAAAAESAFFVIILSSMYLRYIYFC